LIKINVHYILIIIECHVYIVVLNVLYDDVYMYTTLQIKVLFCSVYRTVENIIFNEIVNLLKLKCYFVQIRKMKQLITVVTSSFRRASLHV